MDNWMAGTGINGWSTSRTTRLIYRKLKSIYNFDDADSASKFKYYFEELRFWEGYVTIFTTALNKYTIMSPRVGAVRVHLEEFFPPQIS